MQNLRVIFMGTPDFAVPCLDRLVAENHDVLAVVTQPDRPKGRGQKLAFSPVKQAALAYGLKVWQPETVKDIAFQNELSDLQPDVIVVVAFGQFLPQNLLNLPPLGCINVHASLLPKYRGAAPIHWAIINGEQITGVTTMYMDAGMDSGDMILKTETTIAPNETTGELHDKLKMMGADLLAETLKMIVEDIAPRTPQDHDIATYASLLTRKIEGVDWTKPATAIHNLVRGLNPWPGAYCRSQNRILKIWQTKIYDTEATINQPGRIIAFNNNGILVETGIGILALCEVQPESKRRLSAQEYARGYNLNVGDILT